MAPSPLSVPAALATGGADPVGGELSRSLRGRHLQVRSCDGTRLHAEVFGPECSPEKGAPTVVLVHGWTCTRRMWHYQVAALAGDHRLVAYDLRGHGQSHPAANGDYTIGALAADLDAVLAATVAEGDRAIAVGHSLGAMSVVAWAGEHRHRVRDRLAGVILVDTGVERLLAGAHVLGRGCLGSWFQGLIGPHLVSLALPVPTQANPLVSRALRHLALGPRPPPALVELCQQMFRQCPADVRAALGTTLAALDLTCALDALDVPTVVIVGELDRLTPPHHARAIAAAVAGAVLVEIPTAGHMAPLEAPIEVSGQIRVLARRTGDGEDGGDPARGAR